MLKSKSAFSGYNWYCLIVKLPLNGGHWALRIGGYAETLPANAAVVAIVVEIFILMELSYDLMY